MKRNMRKAMMRFFKLLVYNLKPSNHKLIRSKNQEKIKLIVQDINSSIEQRLSSNLSKTELCK